MFVFRFPAVKGVLLKAKPRSPRITLEGKSEDALIVPVWGCFSRSRALSCTRVLSRGICTGAGPTTAQPAPLKTHHFVAQQFLQWSLHGHKLSEQTCASSLWAVPSGGEGKYRLVKKDWLKHSSLSVITSPPSLCYLTWSLIGLLSNERGASNSAPTLEFFGQSELIKYERPGIIHIKSPNPFK